MNRSNGPLTLREAIADFYEDLINRALSGGVKVPGKNILELSAMKHELALDSFERSAKSLGIDLPKTLLEQINERRNKLADVKRSFHNEIA